MDRKKVTRRIALGSVVGALAGAPLVIRALKARYGVAMPSDTGTVKVTVNCNGKDITVEVPRKIPGTPQERKELEKQVEAQLKKYPVFIEAETQDRLKLRDKRRKEAIADYDELEKRQLADLAKQPFSEKEKQAAARAIKEHVRASRDRSLALIDKLARDDIQRLSKP